MIIITLYTPSLDLHLHLSKPVFSIQTPVPVA